MRWTSLANSDPASALEQWRTEVARLYEGREPETPQGMRLAPFIGRFALPRSAFEDLIDGVAMDLQRNRYDTFDELRQYCLRVASAVGLICVEIFGYRDLQTRDYAIDLGIALQLTNIIRDVAPDLERGRMYIPTEDLRRFGCTEDDLRGGHVSENVRRLLAFQVERARRFYRKPMPRFRAATSGVWWRRASWAPFISSCCDRSSAPGTTCFAGACASRGRARR